MPSSSGKMHPALDYLNASIDLAQTLISEQALQFGGVVDRIHADDSALSDLSKDLLRFWANGWSGWGRLFSQPHSMFMARRGLVPTLVFLIDSSAEAGGPKTVELPGAPAGGCC